MTRTMKRKMLLNSGSSLICQLVTVIYGFILPRLILDQFGSEINGLTQSIKQFLGIITFLDLGVGQVVRSALYRPLATNDYNHVSTVLASGRSFYRRLAAILAVYVVVLMGIYPIISGSAFDHVYIATLIAAMAITSFAQYYFGIVNDQLLHADQRSYVIYGSQIICYLFGTLACVWLIRMDASIQTVKLVTSVIFLLRPLTSLLYIRRRYPIDRKIRYEGEPIAQKWNGMAQHFSAVILDGTDTIVLTFFSTLTNVSVYSVYYMVIASLQQFYQSATAGIHSAAGALWAKDDRDAQNRLFDVVEPALHFGTVLMFSCAGVLILPFVRVYTIGLTDADYIQPLFAVLLVAAYAIRCLRTPYNIWILAAGHYKQTQRCHITAAAMNLILSVLAVRRFGLVGVAVGTLCAMIYQTGWMALYNVRHLLKRPLISVVKQFAVDLLSAAVILLCCQNFTMQENSYLGWFILAIKTGCTALAVIGVMLLLFYPKLLKKLLRRGK